MKEFWAWVAIVTLIIGCIMILSFMVLHTNKQLKRSDEQLAKANAILQRLEENDKSTRKGK